MLERHIREINERRNEMINHLYFAKRPYSGRTPQDIARFEKLLLQLEKDRRAEYLGFWTDVVKVRGELLEAAAEYEATRSRAALLDRATSAGRLRSRWTPYESQVRVLDHAPYGNGQNRADIALTDDPDLLCEALSRRDAWSGDA